MWDTFTVDVFIAYNSDGEVALNTDRADALVELGDSCGSYYPIRVAKITVTLPRIIDLDASVTVTHTDAVPTVTAE